MDIPSTLAGRQPGDRRDRNFVPVAVRLAANVVLPIAIAATTAVGAISHGAIAVYWFLGTAVGLILNGLITYNRDRASDSMRETAIRTAADLTAYLNDTWNALVTALGKVTVSEDPGGADRAFASLSDKAVDLAQSVLKATSASSTRAAFYSLKGDSLKREYFIGWSDCPAPRPDFQVGRSEHDNQAIRIARGEDSLLVENLEEDPPPYFMEARTRVYKSLIAVPVRAGGKSYGLLTADSSRAYALTKSHQGFLILIAGLLGAGVAHVEAVNARQNLTSNP